MPDFQHSINDPNVLLALSLSIPNEGEKTKTPNEFTVKAFPGTFQINIPYSNTPSETSAKLLASKETIAFALLLLYLFETRFERDEFRFEEFMRKSAHECYQSQRLIERSYIQSNSDSQENIRSRFIIDFFEHLDVNEKLTYEFDELTHQVLEYLEDEGLVVDPAVTASTGLMVLAGLIPVRWSVRTPKGQEVYREIKIRAGLWTLDIQRKRRGPRKFTDWDFNFRGVRAVKKVLRAFAEDFLSEEEEDRSLRGKPTLPPPDKFEDE